MQDNAVDNEALTPIAQEMAQNLVDTEIARHPELLSQRNTLLQNKVNEAKEILQSSIQTVLDDIKIAFDFLGNWLQNLPPEDKERLQKEFDEASQIAQTDEFLQGFQDAIEDPAKTTNSLQQVLKLTDKTMESIYAVGYKLQMSKDFIKAKGLFRLLTILNPSISEYWINLGFTFMNFNLFSDAEKAFEIATKINPENPQGLYFSAICFSLQKENDKALAFCEDGLELTKDESGESDWKKSFLELKNSLRQSATVVRGG